MNRAVRSVVLALLAVSLGAGPARADIIVDAGTALGARDYQRARALVIRYYDQGGKSRYRADFIRAVSECKLYHGSPGVLPRLKRLHSDYYLPSSAASEVNRWISWCTPRPTQSASASGTGVGVSVQGMGVEPSTASLAVAEPTRLRAMGPLAYGMAYRGGDYGRVTRPSAQSCQRTCQLEPRCLAMTFDSQEKICWLKNRVPPSGQGQGWVSSRKLDN